MSDDSKQQIAELKAELDRVKASLTPAPYDDAAAREWANEMHQMRERRASAVRFQTRDQLRAMAEACSAADIKDLVSHNTIPSRSAAGASGQLTKTSSSPGIPGSNTSGWVNPSPLGPPPGIGYVDRLCEVDSAKQRGQAMIEEARRNVAEEKPE